MAKTLITFHYLCDAAGLLTQLCINVQQPPPAQEEFDILIPWPEALQLAGRIMEEDALNVLLKGGGPCPVVCMPDGF